MAPKKKRLRFTDFFLGKNPTEEDRLNLAFLLSSIPSRADENWSRLLVDKSFERAIIAAHKRLAIPDGLESSKDGYAQWAPIEEGEIDLMESHWVDRQSREKRHAIEETVKSLLVKYDLTIDFDDHVRYWLLYRKPPVWIAPSGIEHAIHVISNPNEMLRVPLTTVEKRLVKAELRKRFGVKNGRPGKGAASYSTLLGILDKVPVNKSRRSRTYKATLDAIKSKRESPSKTYGDVVDEQNPQLLNDIVEGKVSKREMPKMKSRVRTLVSRYNKKVKR